MVAKAKATWQPDVKFPHIVCLTYKNPHAHFILVNIIHFRFQLSALANRTSSFQLNGNIRQVFSTLTWHMLFHSKNSWHNFSQSFPLLSSSKNPMTNHSGKCHTNTHTHTHTSLSPSYIFRRSVDEWKEWDILKYLNFSSLKDTKLSTMISAYGNGNFWTYKMN